MSAIVSTPFVSFSWKYRQKITFSSTNIANDLTNFTVLVTEANLDNNIWNNAAADASDVIFTDAAGSILNREIIEYDPVTQKFRTYVNIPLLSASADSFIYLLYGNDDASFALNDLATWNTTEDLIVHLSLPVPTISDSSQNNRIINVIGQNSTWKSPTFVKETAISPDLNSHQGITTIDGTIFWTFDTNTLYRRDSSWNILTTNLDPVGDMTATVPDHVGDGDIYNNTLYLPIEFFNLPCTYSDQYIVLYDATTLAYISEHDISAQGHEVSGLVVEPAENRITITSYCQDGFLYQYDLTTFAFLGTVTLSQDIIKQQGITRIGNYYYITSNDSNSIFKVALDGTVVGEVYVHDPSFTTEGIGTDGSNLYFLIDEGTLERVHTLEFTDGAWFDGLDPTVIEDGVYLTATIGDKTTRSIRTWFEPADDIQRAIVSVSENIATPNNRATISIDNGNALGTWDSNGDSWLYTNPVVDPPLNIVSHTALTFVDSTSRTIFFNGAPSNSVALSSSPAGRDTLFIGVEDLSTNEIWNGAILEVRVSDNVLSDAWIAFEDLNFRSNASTYTASPEEIGVWRIL